MPRLPRKPSRSISPARLEALTALMELERSRRVHADDLLRSPRIDALSPQDRNLTTTLVLGVLRWQIRLDALIRQFLSKPNARLDPAVQIALRLGAFQLVDMDRIPAHAAISESVELAKLSGHSFAARMVNAVLRKIALLPKSSLQLFSNLSPAELAASASHPAWLVERWIANYGIGTATDICNHGQAAPETTLRLSTPTVETELAEQGIQLAPGALLTAARRVLSGDVIATEAFRDGRVRIQDEGSQLIAEIAGCGESILDACAAPGGKTLILAERSPGAEITACEVNPARFKALQQRLAGTGVRTLNQDASRLESKALYDLALVDVPCSGTGTLGRNPEIRHRLRPEELARHAERQRAILRSVLRTVRPGGRAVYSTCSLEPEENAQVVAAVLEESPGWRLISLAATLDKLDAQGRLIGSGADNLRKRIGPNGSLTLLPAPETQTDGFFVALLEKSHG